jgi:carbamoyl-phosphate synthase large subunit
MKIGVTGVGGGVGQSILKALRETEYDLVALDADPLAAGLYGIQSAYLIPYAASDNFIPSLLRICDSEKITLLFPGLDAELLKLSRSRDLFRELGTQVVISRPEVIEMADNKLTTFKKLHALGINIPETIELTEFSGAEIMFPVIVKQKVGGARSSNVFYLEKRSSFDDFINNLKKPRENFVVQKYIGGDEYTCGSVSFDGACHGVVVMRRVLRNGDTYKSFSERNAVLEDLVLDICNKIKPMGACNVQLKLEQGIPYVFEINARCSGTTASRALCGFNEPKMIADKIIKGISPKFEIKELTVLRYWEEIAINNADIIKQNGER